MGLIAERAANRGQTRQTYRTMARMQRRRSFVQDRLGTKEDFSHRQSSEATTPTPSSPPGPEYVGELERLAELRQRGILSDEEFEAKKKQILGI